MEKVLSRVIGQLSLPWFQIGSPYLEDVNELIHLANQMGIIDAKLQTYYPNAFNCLTRTAVEETNIKQSKSRRVLKIEHISGILLIILSIGLGGALVVFLGECIAYKMCFKKDPSKENKSQQGRMKHAETKRR